MKLDGIFFLKKQATTNGKSQSSIDRVYRSGEKSQRSGDKVQSSSDNM